MAVHLLAILEAMKVRLNTESRLATILDPNFATCALCKTTGTANTRNKTIAVTSNVRAFKHESFTVWRCGGCGSLHSLEAVDLDYYYSRYPLKHQNLDLPTRLAYKRRLAPMLKAKVPKDARILDYGCGQGLFVEFLGLNGFTNVKGYDPYSKAYNHPKILDGQFDVIVAQDVIEHVEDPAKFLEQLRNLLSPQGLAFIGTPRAEGIDLDDPQRFSLELHQPYHRHILSEASLRELAREKGFHVRALEREFYFNLPIPGLNMRFMWEYVRRKQGLMDALFEPIDWKMVWRSPKLVGLAFFGYLAPYRSNMLATLEKSESVG